MVLETLAVQNSVSGISLDLKRAAELTLSLPVNACRCESTLDSDCNPKLHERKTENRDIATNDSVFIKPQHKAHFNQVVGSES